MNLAEYFRIPAAQRLSRLELAKRLNDLGHEITPEAIGIWIRADKVPEKWVPLVESVLNSVETGIQKPTIQISNNNE